MKDVRINFGGANATYVDLTGEAADKQLYAQKCLVNLATEQGSDPTYAERGTNLLRGAIAGLVVSANEAVHLGNFAALDTLAFVNTQEYSSTSESPDRVTDMSIGPISYSQEGASINYNVVLTYADGTETTDITELPTTL